MLYISSFILVLVIGTSLGKSISIYGGAAFHRGNNDMNSVNGRNMVTVPTSCPPGQELVNGICRDIWRRHYSVNTNAVDGPTKCQGSQHLINGVCKDIWTDMPVTQQSSISVQNMVTVPTSCPEGQELINGVCRDIWRWSHVTDAKYLDAFLKTLAWRLGVRRTKDMIGGQGSEPKAEHILKMNVHKNIISVPSQCPEGYRPDANGICRQILH